MYSQVYKSYNILALILQCQIRHPSILEFKSGIDLLIEITHPWDNRNCDANTGLKTTSFILSSAGMNI